MAEPKPKKSSNSKFFDTKSGLEPFEDITNEFMQELETNTIDIISDYNTRITSIKYNLPEWCINTYMNKNKDKDGFIAKLKSKTWKVSSFAINAKFYCESQECANIENELTSS